MVIVSQDGFYAVEFKDVELVPLWPQDVQEKIRALDTDVQKYRTVSDRNVAHEKKIAEIVAGVQPGSAIMCGDKAVAKYKSMASGATEFQRMLRALDIGTRVFQLSEV